MGNIIVAFSKPQDGRNIRNILVKHGIQVTASCTSGAQVLASTDDLRSGIVVSGYRFGDMTCRQLADQLPPGFDLLLIASPSRWSGEAMGRIVCLPAPFKMGDLVSTVRMIEQTQAEKRRRMRRQPPQKRREEDQKAIDTAKAILMERNRMTEPEAHKYLQKCSMDSQVSLIEAAQMVISLYKMA